MKRRAFSFGVLMAALSVPLATRRTLAKSTAADDQIIIHKNWILKASDLDLE